MCSSSNEYALYYQVFAVLNTICFHIAALPAPNTIYKHFRCRCGNGNANASGKCQFRENSCRDLTERRRQDSG